MSEMGHARRVKRQPPKLPKLTFKNVIKPFVSLVSYCWMENLKGKVYSINFTADNAKKIHSNLCSYEICICLKWTNHTLIIMNYFLPSHKSNITKNRCNFSLLFLHYSTKKKQFSACNLVSAKRLTFSSSNLLLIDQRPKSQSELVRELLKVMK